MNGRQRAVSSASDRSYQVSSGHGKDHRCGAGPCHPSCMQPCANMKAFTAAFACLVMLHCIYGSYAVGILRTVEKRFGFSSYQTGIITSVADLTQMALVLIVGYVGRKTHKPRYLSISGMCSTIGLFLAATPYFIYGSYQYKEDSLSTMSVNETAPGTGLLEGIFGDSASTDDINYQICHLDELNVDSESMCGNSDNERQGQENTVAFYLLLCHSLFIGLGYSGLGTLGLSYIDENIKKADSSIYVGTVMSMVSMGPIIGFPLAAFCTRLPENLIDSSVSIYDPAFIGAWWLGYVIIGVAMAICFVPMFFFPKHFEEYYISSKTEPKKRGGSTSTTVATEIKEFPRSLWKLISNPALVLLGLSEILCMYYIIGVLSNQPRYMEIHFGQPAFVANIATALSGALTGAVGTFLGGVVMKVFKLKEKGAALIIVGGVGVTVVGLFGMLSMGCVHAPSVYEGGSHLTEFGYNVSLECNLNCGCSRDSYQPVCDSRGVEYFSPCHAGCTTLDTNSTSNCACLDDPGTALSREWCGQSCPLFMPYVALDAVITFLVAMAEVPVTILIFRLVEVQLKAFALGVMSFLKNLLGWVPGPILFGALFDSSCLLWKTSCGERLSCLVYDTTKYRYLMHGVPLVFVGVAFACTIGFYFLIRKRGNDEELKLENDAPEKEKMNPVVDEQFDI